MGRTFLFEFQVCLDKPEGKQKEYSLWLTHFHPLIIHPRAFNPALSSNSPYIESRDYIRGPFLSADNRAKPPPSELQPTFSARPIQLRGWRFVFLIRGRAILIYIHCPSERAVLSNRNHGEPFQADAEVEFCMLKTLSVFLFGIVMMIANCMVFLIYRGYANPISSLMTPIHSSIEPRLRTAPDNTSIHP